MDCRRGGRRKLNVRRRKRRRRRGGKYGGKLNGGWETRKNGGFYDNTETMFNNRWLGDLTPASEKSVILRDRPVLPQV